MNIDPTEIQGGVERRRAREMSLKRGCPPTDVPGYEPEQFLGVGAYGEVWVARERNTGRRVAIKFYAHRGGLDWSLLSREVEKLAFLFADRYVVQLVGVGWDAEPPYYIMEYLDRGSLADRIAQGPLPVDEAVALLRDVATGLVHAHGKGVLHCDLKPANILLDQDGKPRLADFGQSRLSTEQAPALGTMFYMAPEQADLEAVPDARWDVYALGALLYCMLTGTPPHRTGKTVDLFERTPELVERLAHYRQTIEQSLPPSAHRKRRGVDKMLAAIVDRCLAVDPNKRFPNVQAVLDALDDRAARLARRPMMVLGAIGPALLLAVVTWFTWQGFHTVLKQTDEALVGKALDTNGFAAQNVALAAAYELDRRYQLVAQVATSDGLSRDFADALAKSHLRELQARLSDLKPDDPAFEPLRTKFQQDSERQALQKQFGGAIALAKRSLQKEQVASWLFCDARGLTIVRSPESATIGKNYGWRRYFHGGPREMEKTWRPKPDEHVRETSLSDVFRSEDTSRWIVAISAPVYGGPKRKTFLGVVVMTVRVGQLVDLGGDQSQFAVLVDNRPGEQQGVILQHPLFEKLLSRQNPANGRPKLPDHFKNYRVKADDLPDTLKRQENYHDPLADDPEGGEYRGRWLARMEQVRIGDRDTGLIAITQQAYNTAIGTTLERLTSGLLRYGLIAIGLIVLLMASLWGMAKKLSMNG